MSGRTTGSLEHPHDPTNDYCPSPHTSLSKEHWETMLDRTAMPLFSEGLPSIGKIDFKK